MITLALVLSPAILVSMLALYRAVEEYLNQLRIEDELRSMIDDARHLSRKETEQ